MFVRTSMQNAEATRGVWGHALPEKFELPRSILGHTIALNQKHFDQAFATNVQCKVTVVLPANTHTLRSEEHQDLLILRIWI